MEQFLSDLRAQRLGKRRDPRIDLALPVLTHRHRYQRTSSGSASDYDQHQPARSTARGHPRNHASMAISCLSPACTRKNSSAWHGLEQTTLRRSDWSGGSGSELRFGAKCSTRRPNPGSRWPASAATTARQFAPKLQINLRPRTGTAWSTPQALKRGSHWELNGTTRVVPFPLGCSVHGCFPLRGRRRFRRCPGS